VTLDADMQAVVDQRNALGWDMTAHTVSEVRAAVAAGLRAQLALGVDEVAHVADLEVPANPPVPCRHYRPGGADGGGLLVWFHGGGFCIGDLDTHDQLCRRLAVLAGAQVLSVDYRLAPEHPWPAAVDDAVAVARWATDAGGGHGWDTTRVAVGGDSAGGSLAAVVALEARDAGLGLVHQVLAYPGTDHTRHYPSLDLPSGYLYDAAARKWFYDRYLPDGVDRSDRRISPLCADRHAGLCPATVFTAGHDPLRDEGRAYAEALYEAGVPVTHVEYPGLVHGFLNQFLLVAAADEATRIIGDTLVDPLAP